MESLVAKDQAASERDDSTQPSPGDLSDHASSADNHSDRSHETSNGTLDSSAAAYISEAVTVDSAHHYPNGDNVEVIHSPGEHVTNDITMATKRASPLSCSSVAKRQKQRKREQDKMAALKYRHRKKQEVMALDEQQTKLEHENTELIRKIELAEEQIIMLKSLLRKIYAPCNHSNSISDSTPQSSPNSSSE